MTDYIKWIRNQVGHAPIFVNAASGIIVNAAGAVLLQRRGGGERENAWSIPGGVMEIGERAQDTVRREIREETGLEVEIGDLVGIYTCPELVEYPNTDKCQMVTQVFVCRSIGGQLKIDGDETLELTYFHKEDRPKLFREHLERAMQDFEARIFGVSR